MALKERVEVGVVIVTGWIALWGESFSCSGSLCLAGVFKCEAEEWPSLTLSPLICHKSQCFKANFDRSARTPHWEKRSWNYFSLRTNIYCMQSKAPLRPLRLSLPLSPPLFVSVSVQTISPRILNEYFSAISECRQKRHIRASVFLQFEAVLFLVSPRASYLVLCDGEGASISEDPPHPYQWLPFIWCHWKCMHFLLGRMKRKKKVKIGNQKWRINWV